MPSDGWVEFNGLAMGPGTQVIVRRLDGLNLPDLNDEVVDNPSDHGAWAIAQLSRERVVTMEAVIRGKALMNSIRQAFLPQIDPLPFRYKVPGETERRVYALPIRSAWRYEEGYKIDVINWVTEILCPDPRIYDDVVTSMTFIAATSIQNVTNAGIFPTPLTVTITGDAAAGGITIRNNTTGESLKVNVNLALSDELVVDFANRTIKVNDISMYSALDSASKWWDLNAGVNQVEMLGLGSASAELAFRSAWL